MKVEAGAFAMVDPTPVENPRLMAYLWKRHSEEALGLLDISAKAAGEKGSVHSKDKLKLYPMFTSD